MVYSSKHLRPVDVLIGVNSGLSTLKILSIKKYTYFFTSKLELYNFLCTNLILLRNQLRRLQREFIVRTENGLGVVIYLRRQSNLHETHL